MFVRKGTIARRKLRRVPPSPLSLSSPLWRFSAGNALDDIYLSSPSSIRMSDIQDSDTPSTLSPFTPRLNLQIPANVKWARDNMNNYADRSPSPIHSPVNRHTFTQINGSAVPIKLRSQSCPSSQHHGLTAISLSNDPATSPLVSHTEETIKNENNDRNYFTYEANAKSTDIDNVHHGGSAIVIQIKEVNKEAETSCEFIYKASTILCNSISATICLGVLIIIPVAMISIGVKYLNECPKQPKIPIYLLVGGCFGLLFLLVVIWRQIQHRRFESLDGFDDVPGTEGGMGKKSSPATDIILALFHIAWLILGTYWVFGIWKPHFSQLLHDPNNWCDKTIYVFAVFQILLCYSLFSFAFLVTLGFCICYQVSVIVDEPVR